MQPPRTFLRQQNRFGMSSAFALGLLLVVPTVACYRLALLFSLYFVGGYFLLISGITYWFYHDDKRCALAGLRRTPEATLHFAEMIGGWPGAFVAQRLLRHKIIKVRYQIVFWMIVTAHELAAIDYVKNWRFTKAAFFRLFGHAG